MNKNTPATPSVRQALSLTDREWEALEHRLGEADAIGECLADQFAPDDTEDVAELLRQGKLKEALEVSRLIVNAVLRDAVEGSTWVACADNESEAKGRGAYRTLCSLARKVAKYIGVDPKEVSVPTC